MRRRPPFSLGISNEEGRSKANKTLLQGLVIIIGHSKTLFRNAPISGQMNGATKIRWLAAKLLSP